MIGTSEENLGNLEIALEYYENGYSKLTNDVTNKEDFYEPIESVKKRIRNKKITFYNK